MFRPRLPATPHCRSIPHLMSDPSTTADIDAAVAALRRGECIGLPTETVYGLAADARNPAAVRRIFALKGRPADHPLIVHLPDGAMLDEYAVDIAPAARALAARFWPGPLTLILPRAAGVPLEVTGGQETVGLRVPSHPVARRVLAAFGAGLAAPSANRFGRISPTRASHVREEFGGALPIVLEGGDCAIGIESTIVDCSGDTPRILRPGSISRVQIEAVVGSLDERATSTSPRVSGMLDKHYAPRTPLRLGTRDDLLQAAPDTQLLSLGMLPEGRPGIALPNEPQAYAKGLYAALRTLDGRHATEIIVERPPETVEWIAVHDRLRRSAAGAGDAH
jgi:L-threonylcarbamoyladenylate synthase